MKNTPVFLSVLVFCLIAGLLVFALGPARLTPAYVVNHDKAFHALGFFIFAMALSYINKHLSVFVHAFILIALAVSIEAIQYFFSGRGFSARDIFYDLVGIAIFYLLVFMAKKST